MLPKDNIELPLLQKNAGPSPVTAEHTSTLKYPYGDLENSEKPKYFHFGFLNRLIFHWANKIIKVSILYRIIFMLKERKRNSLSTRNAL